jgi:hypothetical protein
MPRRNQGPRLKWLDKRGCFYIVWTERGRSRERSTGTADREQAQIALAEFLHHRTRSTGPRDPNEVLVTDLLADYAEEVGASAHAPQRIGYAVAALAPFWANRTVADVTRQTCKHYVTTRGRSNGTTRRELGVLRAAIKHAHREGRLTRPVAVHLPDSAEPRDRWLTRQEAAALLRAALRDPRTRLYLPLFILIGLYCGRRKEAIQALRWAQVDLEAGRIDFRLPGVAQTNKRRGLIPIPPKLLPHLRRARQRGTELGFVIHSNGRLRPGLAELLRQRAGNDVARAAGLVGRNDRHAMRGESLRQRGCNGAEEKSDKDNEGACHNNTLSYCAEP